MFKRRGWVGECIVSAANHFHDTVEESARLVFGATLDDRLSTLLVIHRIDFITTPWPKIFLSVVTCRRLRDKWLNHLPSSPSPTAQAVEVVGDVLVKEASMKERTTVVEIIRGVHLLRKASSRAADPNLALFSHRNG
jgi:hypothetical protein